MSNKVIHVAAGVIINPDGKVLIARRPDHVHQGGLWEFPGGKLESDEPVEEALKRELHEELGIDIQLAHPLIRVHHDYSDKSVLLDVWKITAFTGNAHGREGQAVKWVKPEELEQFSFPEANKPIITAAQLPERYMITGEYDSLEYAAEHIQKRIQQGIRLIQFRAYYLTDDEYLTWANKLIDIAKDNDCSLLLNRNPDVIAKLDVPGVHLSSAILMKCKTRESFNKKLLSASVHNSEELNKAMDIGVDFVVVAPVLQTETHPDAVPLGWDNLYQLTEQSTVPVYALGGMREEHIEQAQQHGAQGIAAIRGLYGE
jgi:8-oxo-dGTP diphosphatase